MATVRKRLQYKGLRRSLVRKLLNALNSVTAADNRAKQQASDKGTVPVLFAASPAVKAAVTLLQNTCVAAMAATG